MRDDLPSGTVTFLFTDVEGSTRLLRELGAEAYAAALAEHRRLIREACAAHDGVEVDTQGDAFFFAFPTAPGALAAASRLTDALASGPIEVRVGLHTGTPLVTDEGYVGDDVHFAARVAAAGHGGQVIVSGTTAELVELTLTDLGEHRLKDIAEPGSIFQLGDGSFPPLKTIANTNLPRPASSFLGRERELEEVVARIEDGARLVTLTGPGGTGKTRLALEAAASLVGEYKAGVFWVGLATLRDSALVTETIAQTLGAKDGLADHIGEREMLLLLDNLEQVIDAAPELSELLQACPNLTCLVTSRELLRVQGEVDYPVPPLAEPEAVSLFCERSQLEPNEDIAELCARLDKLPLAVELAAARTKALTPAQILERLSQRLDLLKGGRDADPRQQTLRATIEWSYDLLTPGEQQLFARLSVFAGGCTLEAAEEVAGANLDVLQSLVEKSLVRFTDERYWMLETIREFSTERLEASAEAAELRRRHAERFLALAKEAEPHLRKRSREWLGRLEREHDNIRATLDWLEASGESGLVLELAAAVCWFWGLRGHLVEGRHRVEAALAGDERPTAMRANALMGAADFALDTGDRMTARVRAEEALGLQRRLGDDWGAAYSLVTLGLSVAEDGDWAAAQRCFDESVRLFREVGDEHEELEAARRLAWSYESLGDRERARALHEDNLRRARAGGDASIEARSLGVLATYLLDETQVDEAVPLLVEAHRLHGDMPDMPDRYSHAILVCRFARALELKGEAATAARLLSCFETLSEEFFPVEDWVVAMNEVTLSRIRAQVDEVTVAEARKDGRALTVDEAIELAVACLD